MRQILCTECGSLTPTPVEDIFTGKIPRRTYGKLLNTCYCDICGKTLPVSTDVIALSIPRDIGNWERFYMYNINGDSK